MLILNAFFFVLSLFLNTFFKFFCSSYSSYSPHSLYSSNSSYSSYSSYCLYLYSSHPSHPSHSSHSSHPSHSPHSSHSLRSSHYSRSSHSSHSTQSSYSSFYSQSSYSSNVVFKTYLWSKYILQSFHGLIHVFLCYSILQYLSVLFLKYFSLNTIFNLPLCYFTIFVLFLKHSFFTSLCVSINTPFSPKLSNFLMLSHFYLQSRVNTVIFWNFFLLLKHRNWCCIFTISLYVFLSL